MALPIATRLILEQQLSKHVAVTRIGDIDINPFLGRIKISQLQVDGEGQSDLSGATIYADIALLPLFSGNFIVEELAIEGVQLRIEEPEPGKFVVLLPLSETEEAPEQTPENVKIPLFAVNRLQLSDVKLIVAIDSANGELAISQLNVDNLSSFSAESEQPEAADLKLDANWNDSTLQIDGKLNVFAETPSFVGNIAIDQINLAELERLLPAHLRDLKLGGTAATAIAVTAVTGETTKLKLSADLNFSQLAASKSDLFALQIGDLSNQLSLDLTSGQQTEYNLKTDTAIEKLSLRDNKRKLTLAQFDRLQLDNLESATESGLMLDKLQLEQLAVAAKSATSTLFSAKTLGLESIEFAEQKLAINNFNANQLNAKVDLTAESDIELVNQLQASIDDIAKAFSSDETRTTTAEAVETPDTSPELAWVISRIAINDFNINLTSSQYPSPLKADLLINSLLATNFGNGSNLPPGTVKLDSNIGKYGKLAFEGEFESPLQNPALSLSGHLDAIEMPMISPYMEHLLGYELTSGQYDQKFNIKLKDMVLKSENTLNMRKLKVDKAEGVEPVTELPVSLDFALNLLRDSKGKITLELPIEGHLDDPSVNLESIIGQAISKALTSGSSSLLKFALQPYGAIMMGAEMGLKLANQITLEPMAFTPGSADLTANQTTYADKLAELVKTRPELELSLCGRANEEDKLALAGQSPDANKRQSESAKNTEKDDQSVAQNESGQVSKTLLLSLASARQANLKQYLVETRQTPAKQLFECKPAVDLTSPVAGVVLGL